MTDRILIREGMEERYWELNDKWHDATKASLDALEQMIVHKDDVVQSGKYALEAKKHNDEAMRIQQEQLDTCCKIIGDNQCTESPK